MTFLTLFFLIGVAHWAAHVIECKECRMAVTGISIFILQALSCVFGWPLAIPIYLAPFFRKGPSEAQVHAMVDKVLAEHAANGTTTHHGVFEVIQRTGETDSEFEARAAQEIAEYKERIRGTQP